MWTTEPPEWRPACIRAAADAVLKVATAVSGMNEIAQKAAFDALGRMTDGAIEVEQRAREERKGRNRR